MVTITARLSGATTVVAADISEFRIETARKNGCKHLFNPSKDNLLEKVKSLSENRGADVVIEITGVGQVFLDALKLARNQGRVMLLSSPHGSRVELDLYSDLHARSLRVMGAHTGTHPAVESANNRWTVFNNRRLAMELMRDGLLDVKSLITHRFLHAKAPDAYGLLLAKDEKTLGIIFDWQG